MVEYLSQQPRADLILVLLLVAAIFVGGVIEARLVKGRIKILRKAGWFTLFFGPVRIAVSKSKDDLEDTRHDLERAIEGRTSSVEDPLSP